MDNQVLPPEGSENKGSSNGEFQPPRHWLGAEELEASYWADPKIKEKRGQEFHDKPIETLEMIERMDKAGIARRDFLTIMGASMAMMSTACARRPVTKIIPYVVKPEYITPGVSNWYASTDPETGYGLLVETREARPIKLDGNPDHPLNRGRLGARQQASLLSLYDPERLRDPLSRVRATGQEKNITWEQADQAIQAKLQAAAQSGGRVRVLSAPLLSDSTRRLVGEFLAAFPAGKELEFDPLNHQDLIESQRLCYGTAVIPRYRFDQADVVVSLGADFLGEWVSPVEHANDWAEKRKLDSANAASANMSKVVVFEPMLTITGSKADERYAVRPGDELKIALAIANELQGRSRFAGDAGLSSVLNSYKAETVAQDIGLEAQTIKQVAELLWNARRNGLVVAGSLHSQTRDTLALQVAVNLLNSMLENEGNTVDGTLSPNQRPAKGFSEVAQLISDMKNGLVDVLVLYRSNPLYTLPPSLGFEEAMKRVPTVIQVADRVDETSAQADFVLPDHHFLENWGDAQPRANIWSIQQPTIYPLFNSRAFQDMLLGWASGAQLRATGLAAQILNAPENARTWHDYLKANWRETLYRQHGGGQSFEAFWESILRKGVLDARRAGASPQARGFRNAALQQLSRFNKSSGDITLALYSKIAMGDGSNANNAWLQEMPDPISTVTWDNYLNVGPTLAQKMGLKTNDVVEIVSGDWKFQLPVVVQPGLHPTVVTAAIGYGRKRAGKVGTEVGVNMYPAVQVNGDRLVFAGHPVKLAKTGRIYRLAMTQWHHSAENRPIINDITLDTFRQNPAAEDHTDPHLRLKEVPTMWPQHVYRGQRWGMAIDLNSCIGCQACVIACQVENNIPVVGRNNVRVSREMHWLRIDRYYSGNPENPEVVFQPMLCQHCENAPCETVCPVLATVHSDDGLNEMVYNRCVGTRYCQNNCPYKVRRFNFFDHWKAYEDTANLVWNPDVTVRSRGVMEKCTFCVQRIRDARGRLGGDKIPDGEVKTACQQTCPTEAIHFGDINDPNTEVSKKQKDARAFRVLEVLNTRPVISYLTLVRNKKESEAHGDNHH